MLILGVLQVAMGLAIAAVWTRDIVAGEKVDRSQGVMRARDVDGSCFLPHWIAEYATAAGLLVGGIGLIADTSCAEGVSLAALGALTYTSTNALGWAFAEPGRRAYAVPMRAGVVLGVVGIVALLAAV